MKSVKGHFPFLYKARSNQAQGLSQKMNEMGETALDTGIPQLRFDPDFYGSVDRSSE